MSRDPVLLNVVEQRKALSFQDSTRPSFDSRSRAHRDVNRIEESAQFRGLERLYNERQASIVCATLIGGTN